MSTFLLVWYALALSLTAMAISDGEIRVKDIGFIAWLSFPIVAVLLVLIFPVYLVSEHGDRVIWRKKP